MHRLTRFVRLALPPPVALTIGTFDGVHLGHQALLQTMKEKGGSSVVVTFSTHPAATLGSSSPPLVTSLSHRLHLLEEAGISAAYVVPFTPSLARQSPEQFLGRLRSLLSFCHLVLGHDAVLGHDRVGDPAYLQNLSSTLGFSLEYLEPISRGPLLACSSAIRKAVEQGDLSQASLLLGRPYSFRGVIQPGKQYGRSLGFPTANLSLEGLVLPPEGVYAVGAYVRGKAHPGVAYLGRAPTFHTERSLLLETHLFDFSEDIYNEEIEVIPLLCLRGDQKFFSSDALKQQIAADCAKARLVCEENFPLPPSPSLTLSGNPRKKTSLC